MVGTNWQQLSGGSTNPWNIVRNDGAYSASYGDHVISDGGDITLPSPQQGEAVMVSEINNSVVTIDSVSGNVEQFTSITYKNNAEEVVFVSDGTDWYVANNLNLVSTTPDSGVARWTFDDADTSGSTALDVWGNNDATINGATTGASGANQTYDTNESYSFDGIGDYVDAGTGVLDSTQPFSVAVWVNFDTLNTTDTMRIVNTNDNDNGFSLFYNSSDTDIEFRTEDPTGKQLVDIARPNTGTWTHYVCVYDGSENILYEDGVDVGSTPSNGSGADPDPFEIGSWSANSEYVEGDIDDVRIYDKGLSSSEVSNLYNTGSING